MHQLPTELHAQICLILRDDNEIHTLRNVALTCRALEEPALDSLWSVLPNGLSPLFRCVTNMCVAKEVVNTEKGGKEILQELDQITMSDVRWSRFFRHARRVRVLTFRDDYVEPSRAKCETEYHWSENSLLRLYKQKFPGTLILPNLQEFVSDDWTWGDTDHELLEAIVGPSIQRLCVALNDSISMDSCVHHFLPALLQKPWKALTSLSLSIPSNLDCPELSGMANALNCAVPPLQTLYVAGWTISAAALSYIASWPALQELHIDKLGPIEDELSPESFPNVRKLAILQSPLSSALTVIAALSGSPVRSLTVNLDAPLSTSEFRALTSLINTSCSSDHLQYIKITDHRKNKGWLDPSTAPESLLETLFVFSKLLAVCISVKPTILLNHPNLANMASSWPNLRLLKITNPRRTRVMSNLHDLLLFAKHCRHLKYISIGTLSSSCVRQSRGVAPLGMVPHQNLQTLCLNSSTPCDVDFVAKYLYAVFPRLRGLVTSGEGNQWDEVFWTMTEREIGLA